MGYTARGNIERIKLKAWASTSGSLSDAQILELLDDSLRSYIVPFLKSVRDEWFVSGSEAVTPDANGRIPLPNSVASTIRTIAWNNNGNLIPLPRIEPENSFAFINQGAGQPAGYMLKGYEIQILPNNVGSISVRIEFMDRPAPMVLDDDAGEVTAATGAVLTLSEVPLAWQSDTPATVDVISGDSPFSAVSTSVGVSSLAGSTLTLSTDVGVSVGDWVSDVGTTPFPNIPVEFHPLLQRSVITELYTGLGDSRLKGSQDLQVKLETELRRTMAPRTQGSARPIINRTGPGMNTAWGGWGWR